MTQIFHLGFQLLFPPYAIIALGSMAGGAIWVATARRRPAVTLSFTQRAISSLLLGGILIGWWQASQAAHQWQTRASSKPTRSIFAEGLPDGLQIEPPASASFSRPDIRVADNRPVLLLQTPAKMEWALDEQYSVVAITFGFVPTAYEKGTTDGAVLILYLVDHGVKKEIFRRALDPIHRGLDRGAQEATITIPPHHSNARLVLISDPGEHGDTAWDWIYLGKFRFGTVAAKP